VPLLVADQYKLGVAASLQFAFHRRKRCKAWSKSRSHPDHSTMSLPKEGQPAAPLSPEATSDVIP